MIEFLKYVLIESVDFIKFVLNDKDLVKIFYFISYFIIGAFYKPLQVCLNKNFTIFLHWDNRITNLCIIFWPILLAINLIILIGTFIKYILFGIIFTFNWVISIITMSILALLLNCANIFKKEKEKNVTVVDNTTEEKQ